MHDGSIVPGLRAEVTITVGADDTAIAMGSGSVPVLATPRIVALVEAAAVATVADHLAEGMTTVGTHIALDHVAPSPIGSEVSAHAEVIVVAGRRIDFAVGAAMGGAEVARGVHRRVVVRREGFGGAA
jgi:predicted thioesterase